MNREDINITYECNIPETFDIGPFVSGYITARDEKRQKAHLTGQFKKVSEDSYEVFLKAILTYAVEMPNSPLMITDEQATHLIKKLKIYKKWRIDRSTWDLHGDEGILPKLTLNGREIVIEETPRSEKTTLFA